MVFVTSINVACWNGFRVQGGISVADIIDRRHFDRCLLIDCSQLWVTQFGVALGHASVNLPVNAVQEYWQTTGPAGAGELGIGADRQFTGICPAFSPAFQIVDVCRGCVKPLSRRRFSDNQSFHQTSNSTFTLCAPFSGPQALCYQQI